MNIQTLLTLVQVLVAASASIVYLKSGSDFAAFACGITLGIAVTSVVRLAINK